MNPATLLLLANPSSSADRRRVRLSASATALAGALLLVANGILRYHGQSTEPLARYVSETGLRGGTAAAVAMLVVPVLFFAVQALRVGSVARDRRVAALRLAGATPRATRAVAAAESGRAALTGGLAAGPVYLLLWLLGGRLPDRAGLVPAPTLLDLFTWLALTLVFGIAGAIAGAAVEGRTLSDPLAARRQMSPRGPGVGTAGVIVIGLVIVAASGRSIRPGGSAVVYALLLGVLLVAMASGPLVVMAAGRILRARGGALCLLAGSRLAADVRSPGRIAGVLLVCGIALGIDAALTGAYLSDPRNTYDTGFYLTGFGLAALAIGIAAAVAVATLVVGAADGLLDARRALSTLAAFGLDAPALTRVLRLQLAAVAVPSIVLGTLVGGGTIVGVPVSDTELTKSALLIVLVALLSGTGALVAAWLTGRALGGHVLAAIDPENLRIA